jgi:hypothetical protein
LDRWSSFHESFKELTGLIRAVGTGEKGHPPSSIVVLSGDVHYGYLAEATFREAHVKSPVYQAVCSPFRNSLPGQKSRLQSLGWTKPGELAERFLTRLAGNEQEEVSWHLTHERPWFENNVATIVLEGQQATLTFEKAAPDDSGEPGLEKIYKRRLA